MDKFDWPALFLNVVNAHLGPTDLQLAIVEQRLNNDIATQHTGRYHLWLGRRFDQRLPRVGAAWNHETKVKEPLYILEISKC